MNYLVYKITNQINGKIYIGVHKTPNVDDGYMGSGKLIIAAIKKYGVENFKKEILAQFESADEMFNEEKNLISQLSPEYNLHPGGNGGFGYINSRPDINPMTSEKARKMRAVSKGTKGHKFSKEFCQNISKRQKLRPSNFTGHKHTQKTRDQMSISARKNKIGELNPQYGKMWIYNDTLQISKMLYKHETIPTGWKIGRRMYK